MKFSSYLQILTVVFSLTLRGQQSAGQWSYVGPNETAEQVKGLMKSVWADPSNADFILAGSCSGGLFKTENGTDAIPQWQNISDSYNGMCYGISDIVVKPNAQNKTIFIASGHNSGLSIGYGSGILKTTDGGRSWQEIGPKGKRKNLFMMEGLVSNKQKPEEMIAYTAKEIFITTDEWQTFEKIVMPVDTNNKNISFCDVEFAPFEPGKFYVCTRTYNFYDAKLFICQNYGKEIKDITPSDIKAERIEIATLENEHYKGRFYAAIGSSDVYVKYYNGNLFKNLNSTPVNHTFSSAHWNLELTVNTNDTNIIYLGMTEISRSINGGKTFEKIANYNGHNTHADVRAMFLQRSTIGGKRDVFLVANDGGISLLDTLVQSAWKSLNGKGLNANQFWGLDVAQSDSMLIAGGTQDNGGFLITAQGNENTMSSCGDGYLGLVLDRHSAIIECNPPSLYYHNIQTHQNSYLQINDARRETRRPLAQKDSFVYVGYGDVWRIKKQNLQNGSGVFENFTNLPVQKDAEGIVKNNTIRCFSIGEKYSALISYANPNWAAKENTGKLFYCENIQDKSPHWADITALLRDKGFEVCRWSEIMALEIDIHDAQKFYLLSRDVSDQTTVLLYRIHFFPDSNKCSIEKINSNLPVIGINKIKTDKYSGVTYLACDDGVYYSNLNSDSVVWNKFNLNKSKLPSVMVTDLAINYVNNTIVAATYGRGVWQSILVSVHSNEKNINKNLIENEAVKIDGKLVVSRKKVYTLNSKLIITQGSSIELKRGSSLIVKKQMVRDQNNKLIDLDLIIHKSKGSKVIYK